MAEADMGRGRGGIGYGADARSEALRADLQDVLSRHGVPWSPGGPLGEPLTPLDTPNKNLVRSDSHHRMNAPTREVMRRAALEAGSTFRNEGVCMTFVAFVMKGTLPTQTAQWVLPYDSWEEAINSFNKLYSDPKVWDEWWRSVQ